MSDIMLLSSQQCEPIGTQLKSFSAAKGRQLIAL